MTTAIQSRWGFHPCTPELHRKLKRLNFLAFEARRKIAAWGRWNVKQPHNRILWKWAPGSRYKEKIGMMAEPLYPPIDLNQCSVIEADYKNARTPVIESQVRGLSMSLDKINSLLDTLEKWFAETSQPAECLV
jgi:hypothetical protein